MKKFQLPADLDYNRGLIEDPSAYFKQTGCKSWLFLVGEEFSKMPGGMSYEQVREATPASVNIPSDPPRVLNIELARQQVEALDSLPRPTLISCRTGPRASAVAYMYSGLKFGADPDEVLAEAEKNQAPFIQFEEYKDWVRSAIESLRKESAKNL
ncbi:MAG TPA: hypothetical protein VNT20_17315 [Flavisolibacter sp.]|jgi:protein tyrosine phosphatase (PTP) superfamily phosphohydrolase (DUF442 family)|nr:hypothetical protein [Flavisolibacter sp.]